MSSEAPALGGAEPAQEAAAPPPTPSPSPEGKSPGIAALIAFICGFFLLSPAVGYFYLGKMKKGVMLLIAGWVVAALVIGAYTVFTLFTIGLGGLICLPVFLVLILVDAYIIYDVYQDAQGKSGFLQD